MDGISRSRGWDKEIPHGVLPMEQLVLSDKWARKIHPIFSVQMCTQMRFCEYSSHAHVDTKIKEAAHLVPQMSNRDALQDKCI